MNGFRVTILTLLCLSVGLMFYAVLFVIPGWQEQYNTYQSSLRISEYEKKNDIHRRQMEMFSPSYEAPEVAEARQEAEEAERRGEQSLNEAEESNILAAARRKEEALAREQARKEQEKDDISLSAVIGLVASYDQNFNFIMIRPAVQQAFIPGAELAVRRNGRIVCEAVVDATDAESGQISATVRIAQLPGSDTIPEDERNPRAGDEVIPSPFVSADELRSQGLPPAPTGLSAPVSTAEPLPGEPAIPAAPATPAEPAEAPLPSLDPLPAPAAAPTAPAASPAPASGSRSLPTIDELLQPSLY